MFVEGLSAAAREGLVTIAVDAPLVEAATRLHAGVDLVVVCGPSGTLAGVVTKTDIVGQISRCQGAVCKTAVSGIMTTDVVLCRPNDSLQNIWALMKQRSFKNVPVVDEQSRPTGILNARTVLQALLTESKDEESMLRDYVMGVGYR